VILTDARVAFLRRIHLFRDLNDEGLAVIAGMLKEETRKAGEVIYPQGSDADCFYILYQGKVGITRIHRKEDQELASFISGDYFGEEALLSKGKRSATVTTHESCYLFLLNRVEFKAVIKKYPKLKAAFEVSAASRKLARNMHFKWVRPDEVIYFIARKHELLLFQSLTGPGLALSVPILLIVYFFLTRAFFAIFGAGILFLAVGAWALWNWIDWGNDYYIVTNERVIWLEKVVGIYDSRQEAPLSTVLSVGVETDVSGRLLDYGTVIVRTYVGKIPFHHVSHPYEAAHMVEEQWTRTKHSASRIEKEEMRNILRQKMGLTVETKLDPLPKLDPKTAPTFYRPSLLKLINPNWFKLRQETGGTVTYRKHFFVLWQQIWQPTVLILLFIVGIIFRLFTLATTPGSRLFDFTNGFKVDTLIIALPIVMVPIIGWWIYQYIDWSNDIFQVTPDQILDIDRKPFGSDERRAAPLENILSTEAHRYGLAGYFLNFGTVEITVGGTHLDFVDVLDPVGVQADIDRRREARIKQKRDAETNAERERMSDWLVAYYENEPELRQRDAAPEAKPKTE